MTQPFATPFDRVLGSSPRHASIAFPLAAQHTLVAKPTVDVSFAETVSYYKLVSGQFASAQKRTEAFLCTCLLEKATLASRNKFLTAAWSTDPFWECLCTDLSGCLSRAEFPAFRGSRPQAGDVLGDPEAILWPGSSQASDKSHSATPSLDDVTSILAQAWDLETLQTMPPGQITHGFCFAPSLVAPGVQADPAMRGDYILC